MLVLSISCGEDDAEPAEDALTGASFSVPVLSFASADTIGEVLLKEHESQSVTVEITITGLSTFRSSINDGAGLLGSGKTKTLEPADGNVSITYVQSLESGQTFSYAALETFDGHIRIQSESGEDIGFADLGQNALTGDVTVYPLSPKNDQGVEGRASFHRKQDNSTMVVLRLSNVESSANHPTHIHNNTALESGTIAIDLTNVKGDTGNSLTQVEQRNDGSAITYQQLLGFNGYINVHKSAADISTLMAQGDVGKNAFTGREKDYTLASVTNPGISGMIRFQERVDGTTLVSIGMEGTDAGKSHPAHIHESSAAETGVIIVDFSNVDGATGKSFTNVSKYNNGTPLTYEELLTIDGYVNVHISPSDLSTLIGQGDIGQNALTGEQVVYPLDAVNGSGVSGELTLLERENGFTLALVQLEGTLTANSYSAIIYSGSKEEGTGSQLTILKSISSSDGFSKTTIRRDKDNAELSFSQLLVSDAHLRILANVLEPDAPVAIANIGANSGARTVRKVINVAQAYRRLDSGIASCGSVEK